MNKWPGPGGPSAAPAGGLIKKETINPKTVRQSKSDSSQQASSIPGAVHPALISPQSIRLNFSY